MKINTDWVCTDPDNYQYGRALDEEGCFEFKEFDRMAYPQRFEMLKDSGTKLDPSKDFQDEDYWITKIIKIEDYTTNELKDVISAYYSEREVKEMLQFPDDEALWIIAECVFEQESGMY